MNDRTSAAELTARFERIAIELIQPSQTCIQNLRRSHFDQAKIAELAESIRQQGVLQPILVRPISLTARPVDGEDENFEIVAGERRWLAAKAAGLTHIDCHIRELTDAQLLEAQLVENLQREGVHPLEEAEGYRELIKLRNIKAEDLGAQIGKSRAYVYARLKLLDLAPEAREALDVGDLDASKALVVARFAPKLQTKIVKDYRSGARPHVSYRAFVENVQNMFTTDLTAAPFPLDHAGLFKFIKVKRGVEECETLPACTACPNYSRNDAELQAAFAADAHVCTDKTCYDAKVSYFYETLRLNAIGAGKTILTGDAAKAALPGHDYMYGDHPGINSKWVRLDVVCHDDVYDNIEPEPSKKYKTAEEYEAACEVWQEKSDAYQSRTYRALLQPIDTTLVQLAEDSKGRLVELYPVDVAAKILAKQGIELDVPKPERAKPAASDTDDKEAQERARADFAKEKQKRAQEIEVRRRVLRLIHTKWKGGLKRDDLITIAEALENCMDSTPVEQLYDKPLNVSKASEAELSRYIILLIAAENLEYAREVNPDLGRIAKQLKIDPAKIRKEMIAEERAKAKGSEPAADPKPAKKKSRK